jgi:tetratricopeptide (TPR) repeat protein
LGLGAYQRAAIEALIKQFPDKWVYRIEYAKSKLKENDPTGAEKLLNEAIQGDPYQVEPHVLLALLSYEGGRFMKAMDHADIALRIDPTYPKALSLFRASFYVAVASKLWCKHGHGPWKKDAVEAVLDSFRKQGLKGVAFFYEVDKEFGRKDDVKKRIQTAAKRCMAKR